MAGQGGSQHSARDISIGDVRAKLALASAAGPGQAIPVHEPALSLLMHIQC